MTIVAMKVTELTVYIDYTFSLKNTCIGKECKILISYNNSYCLEITLLKNIS
jgi:hypothetical protein